MERIFVTLSKFFQIYIENYESEMQYIYFLGHICANIEQSKSFNYGKKIWDFKNAVKISIPIPSFKTSCR